MKNENEWIESIVLELCGEDDYGSWELWWNVSAEKRESSLEVLRSNFVQTITSLIESKRLISKKQVQGGQCIPVDFDPKTLEFEILHADRPTPSSYFWFGINSGNQ